MATTRMHGDVLVLGHALETALTATLLTRRGWKVLWVGAPPPATATLEGAKITTAPGLMPSLANAPALARALEETGLTADFQKLLRPVSLQLLGDRRRLALPRASADERWRSVQLAAEDLRALADEPWSLGFFGRRRLEKKRGALELTIGRPEDIAGEAADALASVFADGPDALPTALRLLADPHVLPGGRATLIALLYRRFVELGGTPVAQSAPKSAESIEVGWSGVKVVLASGDELSARVLLLGLDDDERERLLPSELRPMQKLEKKLGTSDSRALYRLTFLVHPRGLPVPLGPAALVKHADGWALVERRAIDTTREELSIAWRADSNPLPQQEARVLKSIRQVLPFFERHVVGRAGPAPVSHHVQVEGSRIWRPARRVMHARGPLLGLGGIEGAGMLGAALAEKAQQLAPRKDLLK